MPLDLAADALAHLDEFGEPIGYRKMIGQQVGPPRNITGVVDRSPPEALSTPGTLKAVLTVAVANSATTGISAAELDTGGDSIDVAMTVGGTPERRRIGRLRSSDAGMLVLEVI